MSNLSAGSFGQLTIWGGKSPIVQKLMLYFLEERWPPNTHFYWGIGENVSDSEFFLLLQPTAFILMNRGHTVEMWKNKSSSDYSNLVNEKHELVAKLYRDGFKRASVNDYFLTIEDDNLPPPFALSQLAQHCSPDVGQIGGVYRIRGSPEYINVSTSLQNPWTPPRDFEIPNGVFNTPMMGAGYTLYLGSAMRKIEPVQCIITYPNGPDKPAHVAGWDDWVGRQLASMNYRSISDGSLWIVHDTPEVNAYLKVNKLTR